ncbi:MAG: hypothetical protein ACJA2M_001479 [Polaribacter sp.]|jgi:hypothetical protein
MIIQKKDKTSFGEMNYISLFPQNYSFLLKTNVLEAFLLVQFQTVIYRLEKTCL